MFESRTVPGPQKFWRYRTNLDRSVRRSGGSLIPGWVNNEQFFDDQNLIVGVSQSDNEQDL